MLITSIKIWYYYLLIFILQKLEEPTTKLAVMDEEEIILPSNKVYQNKSSSHLCVSFCSNHVLFKGKPLHTKLNGIF